jgi:NTE family protein
VRWARDARSDFQWSSSKQYVSEIVPHARELLTTEDFQLGLIKRVLRSVLRGSWSIFQTRADDFSSLLQERWGITAQLSQVSDTPRWVINATCHETGRNWRFEKFWMSDYLSGYTRDTDIPLSDALAASAALPGLVGPLVLDTAHRSCFKYAQELTPGQDPAKPGPGTRARTEPVTPAYSEVHLWDGGIYDNLGVECLYNFDTGWRQGVDFLVVSDTSGKGQSRAYRPGDGPLIHIITHILMGQIRALRTRSIVEHMKSPEKDTGAFVRIGNTCKKVLEDAGRHAEVAELSGQCLPQEQATLAERMETTAR